MHCYEIYVLKPPQAKLYHTSYKYQESYQGYYKNIALRWWMACSAK